MPVQTGSAAFRLNRQAPGNEQSTEFEE